MRSGLLVVNTLNLEERLVRSGVSLSALVPEDSALDVESIRHCVGGWEERFKEVVKVVCEGGNGRWGK